MSTRVAASVALAVVVGFAFRPSFGDSPTFWLVLAIPTLAIAGGAAVELRKMGRLRALLMPKHGDVTLGFLLCGLVLAVLWLARTTITPIDSDRFGWLLNVVVLFGRPEQIQSSLPLTALVLVLAMSQELIFRGWVHEFMVQRWGERAGFWITLGLYGLPSLPTLWTLRTDAGPNPLVPLAVLVVGLTFGYARRLVTRLPPLMLGHAAFAYFSLTQFGMPGL